MYGVDTPHDFAEWLLGEHDDATYWKEELERPADVTKHPQGQTYVDVEGQSAELALFVLRRADSCGLRTNLSGSRIAVLEPRPTCDTDGCFAKATGTTPYRDLCAGHARQKNSERRRQGLPPERGEHY